VVSGDCDCCVLPVENSYAGEVGQVMDMMFQGSLYVNGIYTLHITHNLLGVERLADSSMREFMSRVAVPCPAVSERAKLRAQHYFDECQRVKEAYKALKEKDTGTFLQDIRFSQESSRALLANTFVPGRYDRSPQQGVDIASKIIGHGAVRIMGGGFAGSILCFVYPEDLEEFIVNMSRYYGKDNVTPLTILDGGPREVK